MQVLLSHVPLLVVLIVAAIGDTRSRTLRNTLTLPLALAGLAQSFLVMHTTTPWSAILGLLAGFALGFILFGLGALGGGDVKLLAAVGAWMGPGQIFLVFLAAAVIGMLIVVGQALIQRRMRKLLYNSSVLAINLAHVGDIGLGTVERTGRSSRSIERPLAYAVPVLLATCLVIGAAAGGIIP